MIKFVKKGEITTREKIIITTVAIILALLISSLFIIFLGLNPIEVYGAIIKGAFGTPLKFRKTIIKAIPLLLAALGVSVAFKMQFWNIGGEGQIIMGAFAASFVALKLQFIPEFLQIPVMMVAGILGGGLWALFPAFLKAKLKTNETIITLMMNYVALNFIIFLQNGPWKDPGAKGFAKIADFPKSAILPKLFGIHIGWIIALVLVILVYIFMNNTKKGYEISVIGESEKTATYAGIKINKTILIALIISGGICGLAGMIQASAVNNTLTTEISGGAGNTAIIIAWLSGLNPFIILIVSILFAGLVEGGVYIQSLFGIPQSVSLIIQSMILFFVLGSQFFINYKLVFTASSKSKKSAEMKLEEV